MSIKIVDNSSYVTLAVRKIVFKQRLIDLTNHLKKLPHHGEASMLNFHLIPSLAQYSLSLVSLKILPLSLITRRGLACLAFKLTNARMRLGDDRSGTSSRCNPRLVTPA